MLPSGRTFYKMSGSGNDFVMVDALEQPADDLAAPETVQALCARGTGIGADGLVMLTRSWAADFRMIYLNSDGSPADLCGNATLCSVRPFPKANSVFTPPGQMTPTLIPPGRSSLSKACANPT